MNAEEYLKGLNEHDPVFEIDTEYEYTEQHLINFAERYHQKQLELLAIPDASRYRELLIGYSKLVLGENYKAFEQAEIDRINRYLADL